MELLEAAGAIETGASTLRPVPLERLRALLTGVAGDSTVAAAVRELAGRAALRYGGEFPLLVGPAVGGRAVAGFRDAGGDAGDEPSGIAGQVGVRIQGGPAGMFAFLEQAWGGGAERPRLRRGGVGARLSPFWLYAGREAFQMDGGAGGGVVLNDEAALDGILVGMPSPFAVPVAGATYLQLGLFRLARYEAVEDPWFLTLRVAVRPAPWLQVALNRSVLFGGHFLGGRAPYDPKVYPPDSTSLTAGDVLGVLVGRNTTRDDQKLGVEVRASLAGAGVPAVAYGELAIEDAQRSLGDPAVLAGILLLARARPTLAIRYEYTAFGTPARICPWCDTLPAYWYWHRRFQSGYAVDGSLLGHPLGGYGFQHLLQLRILGPEARFRFTAAAILLRRDQWNLLEEERPGRATGANLEAAYRPVDRLELMLRAATEKGRAGWRRSGLDLSVAAFF